MGQKFFILIANLLLITWSADAQFSEISQIMQLNFENGSTNSKVSNVAAGLDTNPSAVYTADAIVSTCNQKMGRNSTCGIRTKVICNADYYTGDAHRSESHSMHKSETYYSQKDFVRYEFSFMLDPSWPWDVQNSIDAIFQFKRFSSAPDGFFAIKERNLVYRYLDATGGQILVKKDVPRGVWIDLRVDVYWSFEADGETQISVRMGSESEYTKFAPIRGRNMLSAVNQNAYLKWGIYKPGCLDTTIVPNLERLVYHDNIRVVRLAEFKYSSNQVVLNSGSAATVPALIRGVNNPVCTASPSLPEGLGFDGHCSIVGTPVRADVQRQYLITASGLYGQVSTSLVLKINGPPVLVYPATVSIAMGQQINIENLGLKSYGEITSCTVSKKLPTGMTLATDTCLLMGTPTQTAKTDYEVRATNQFGTSVVNFYLNVVDPPVFYYPNNNVLSFPLGMTTRYSITKTSRFYQDTCRIEDAAGNPITLEYFSVNPVSCTLSGWPAATFAPLTIYVKGTNVAGSYRVKVVLRPN